MSQSPPHSLLEELDPSSAALSEQGAIQAPTIDNLDQSLDGEVSAARGVGVSAFASLQCMLPSWLTQHPPQIPPYHRSGNAKSRSSPQPHNQITLCVTIILDICCDYLTPKNRKEMLLCANIARGRP